MEAPGNESSREHVSTPDSLSRRLHAARLGVGRPGRSTDRRLARGACAEPDPGGDPDPGERHPHPGGHRTRHGANRRGRGRARRTPGPDSTGVSGRAGTHRRAGRADRRVAADPGTGVPDPGVPESVCAISRPARAVDAGPFDSIERDGVDPPNAAGRTAAVGAHPGPGTRGRAARGAVGTGY